MARKSALLDQLAGAAEGVPITRGQPEFAYYLWLEQKGMLRRVHEDAASVTFVLAKPAQAADAQAGNGHMSRLDEAKPVPPASANEPPAFPPSMVSWSTPAQVATMPLTIEIKRKTLDWLRDRAANYGSTPRRIAEIFLQAAYASKRSRVPQDTPAERVPLTIHLPLATVRWLQREAEKHTNMPAQVAAAIVDRSAVPTP